MHLIRGGNRDGLRRLPNATLYGFRGTNGSFGMVGAGMKLPEAVQIVWPYGQSLDRGKTVQIDSRDLRGGVAVDVAVPMTVRNVGRSLLGEDVVLQQALRQFK